MSRLTLLQRNSILAPPFLRRQAVIELQYIGHFCLGVMGMGKNTRQTLDTRITGEAVPGEVSEYGVTASQRHSIHSDCAGAFLLLLTAI